MPKHVPIVKRGVKPIGPYSIAAEAIGRLVFISGQVAIDPSTGEKETGDAAAQATRIMENLGLVLDDLGLDFDSVVKTTIFLVDMAEFAAVNEVYGRYFTGRPPARSTVQVGALPGGFRVEIEAVAAI
ncbi:MAG: reactive intermediate/imine deaminase [Actinobacteria bacterium RBG_16_70_17]|nr:MAG: reactive intermediate/imine deaminase [Actinobacteria bacterium RBG_16_70_17]